jgi:hypothetical protein
MRKIVRNTERVQKTIERRDKAMRKRARKKLCKNNEKDK